MTDKTELLKSAIDEIDRVLIGNKSADVNEVYLNNAKRFISESMQVTTTPFAVGEYHFDKDVNRIVKIENHETGYTEIKYLSDGKLQNSVLYNLADYFDKWIPATAEQIATFKRAEHFAAKGRKLDEFRVGDLVKDEYDQEHKITEVDVWGVDKVVSINIGGNNAHINAKQFDLIQTAEELQEGISSEKMG